uniref:Uncharacterized protein n=1 Tax=viral metagenome TaxID=1070528 RepID=A0A6C0FAY0_9ZZZZ
MYYYLYQNIRRLPSCQKNIFTEDNATRMRMLRNMRRNYIKNIILRLREYE